MKVLILTIALILSLICFKCYLDNENEECKITVENYNKLVPNFNKHKLEYKKLLSNINPETNRPIKHNGNTFKKIDKKYIVAKLF